MYLDQMVISNVAKSLDPVWRANRGEQDPFWVELFDQLDRLLKLNLVICPLSPVHERESSVSTYDAVLLRIGEHLANDVNLEFPELVLGRQLRVALDAYLEGTEPDFSQIDRSTFLTREPNAWLERLLLTVSLPTHQSQIEERRKMRNAAHEAFLGGAWKRWRQETDRSFDDWYEEERSALPDTIGALYIQHLAAVQHSANAGSLPEEVWNWRLEVETAKRLVDALLRAGTPRSEAIGTLLTFLASEQALSAPQNEISALLYAALARQAANGRTNPPSRGLWNDVQATSAYLPYVDAMFVDNETRALLADEPLATRTEGMAAVFSQRNRDEFLEYLRKIEEAAGPEHVELVLEIYGDGWLEPYRTILEYEREREDKREQ